MAEILLAAQCDPKLNNRKMIIYICSRGLIVEAIGEVSSLVMPVKEQYISAIVQAIWNVAVLCFKYSDKIEYTKRIKTCKMHKT